MSDHGNSNRITREYLDSLMIETRYMDSETPDLTFRLFGETFASPIMTAALSHLDHFMFPGAAQALAEGARDAGAILWYGMAPEEEIDRLADTGARMIEIIKPYTDREKIMRKIAIDGETVETVADFILGGSKITADGDCSHEIKRFLLLGRKVMTNLLFGPFEKSPIVTSAWQL